MNAFIQRCSQSYTALSAPRRYLLLCGWVLVLTLILVLSGRPLIDYGKSLTRWQSLAGEVQVLQAASPLSLERWQALASARGVVLTGVEARGDVWQLRGEVARAGQLSQLMHDIQQQGARPLRWGLERRGDGLQFNLDVSRTGLQP